MSTEHPVTIRGVTYPSQRLAAKSLGITPPAIAQAIRRGKLETVGLRSVNGRGKRCSIYLKGDLRDRLRDAPRKINISKVCNDALERELLKFDGWNG